MQILVTKIVVTIITQTFLQRYCRKENIKTTLGSSEKTKHIQIKNTTKIQLV